MRRIVIASVVAAALTLPAQAAAVSDITSPPQVVRSADRLLTLTIPRGALTKAVRVRIKTLKRSALKGKQRAAAAPGAIYELLPHGLRFAKPITITRRVRGFAPSNGTPILVPAVRDATGKWSLLGQPSIRREGAIVVVSGTTRHFSTVAAFDGRASVVLEPSSIRKAVGETFDATVRFVRTSADIEFELDDRLFFSKGAVRQSRQGQPTGPDSMIGHFLCSTAGTGEFGFYAYIDEMTPGDLLHALLGVQRESAHQVLKVAGTAVCEAASPLKFTLTWGHPAGAPSSYVCADITAASGALLQLEATGPAGYSVKGTLQLKKKETATAHGTFSFGIFQIGKYLVRITATADGKSVTKEKSIEVTGAPGSPSCGP